MTGTIYTLLLLRDSLLKVYTHATTGIPLREGDIYGTNVMPVYKRGHYRVDIEGMDVGYIPYQDISILIGGRPLDAPPVLDQGTGQSTLPIPFLYVEDNLSASYNITAMAMVMSYLKVPRKDPTKRNLQYEDELASAFSLHGWRDNYPEHIVAAMRFYGLSCTYSRRSNLEHIRDWLSRGRPLLLEGLWDPWGTIAVVLGLTSDGLVLHLPYLWTSIGPDYSRSGEREVYPISTIARVISLPDPDGLTSIGCYFIHKD
jgi:hypothetical protein